MQFIPQVTRQPETAPWRGGWVAPAGPTPAAMFLRHAGERRGKCRGANPACAMIAAGAPSTHPAPKSRVCRSGVKSAAAGNRPAVAPLSSVGATIEGDTNRRKLDPAQTADPKSQDLGHTLAPKGMGTQSPGYRADTALGGLEGPPDHRRTPRRNASLLPRHNNAARKRGNRHALSTRKGREGFWPHARGGQVADQATVRGNARDMQNSAKGHQDKPINQQP
jgi:hypothetical protein